MKTVRELNENELCELKQSYATQKADEEGNGISYGELADSVDITNEVIFNHYDGIDFVEEDFFCNL